MRSFVTRSGVGRLWRVVAISTLIAFGVPALGSVAGAQGDDGKALFEQSCAGCHTIGGGDGAGPDLEGLADRRDREWVEAFIRDPEAVIASGDAYAQQLADRFPAAMPALGLSDAQLAAIVAYLGFGQPTPPVPTPTQPAPAGSTERGKSLFQGRVDLEAGGPSCLSCHSIAGLGALGGGQLGPDLTTAADRLGGEAGLASWLAAIPSPTMRPIFAGRELTDAERADLAAFIAASAAGERDSGQVAKLVALGLGVAALVVVLALVIWRKRLAAVRRSLVDRATGRTTA